MQILQLLYLIQFIIQFQSTYFIYYIQFTYCNGVSYMFMQ